MLLKDVESLIIINFHLNMVTGFGILTKLYKPNQKSVEFIFTFVPFVECQTVGVSKNWNQKGQKKFHYSKINK